MKELPKVYDPKQVESKIYDMWMRGGYFAGKADPDKKPFSIVMPPPNVTGQLHMGHALDATLQDILTRYKRMQGYAALWVPGTDHAGIATQIKVEEMLRKEEGLTRYDLGREEFLKRVWAWKKQYGNRIVEQQKSLGVSCDWDRSRFTMDEGCSKAVRETFCELYEKGLIYKGNRIINWCPHCRTALSDAEVEYKDMPGAFWYIRYPLKDSDDYLTIATTRPETMLGDTGIAVNPADERYQHLVGKTAILPLVGRELPIVADDYVELDFGTGCVKMTPCHDPNDYEVGLRHNLEQILIFDEDARVINGGSVGLADRIDEGTRGGQVQPRGQHIGAGGCPQAADGAQHPQAAHAVQHDRPARCRRVLPGAAQHHGAVDVAADHGAWQERVQANGLKVPARGVAHAHLGAQPARQRAPAQGRDEVGGNARRQPRQQPADVRLPQLRQHARRVGQGQHRGQQRQPEQAAQQGLVGVLHATISGAVHACWACAGAVFDA